MLVHDSSITERIIRCALSVHKTLGPGLLESTYEEALCIELDAATLRYTRQIGIPVYYKGRLIGEHRPDLVVDGAVVVEIKSVEALAPIHLRQVLAYLRVTGIKVGLLLNFNCSTMRQGIRRVVL